MTEHASATITSLRKARREHAEQATLSERLDTKPRLLEAQMSAIQLSFSSCCTGWYRTM